MTEDLLTLAELIAEQAAHMDAAQHRLLSNVRRFDERGGWSGAKSCAHWLSWRVGWSLGTAREHVRVAKALGSLPAIDDALRLGKVSYCKVRAMTRVATPENERVLLMDAELTTGSQLEKICREYRRLQRLARGEADNTDESERMIRRRDLDNGMVAIEARLYPDEAELVWTALERAAKEMLADSRAADRALAEADAELGADADATCGTCVEVELGTDADADRGGNGLALADDDPPCCERGTALHRDVTPDGDESIEQAAAQRAYCSALVNEYLDIAEAHDRASRAASAASTTTLVDDEWDLEISADLDVEDASELEDLSGNDIQRLDAAPEPDRDSRDATAGGATLISTAVTEASDATTTVVAAGRRVPTFNLADGLVGMARRFLVGESSRTPVEVIVTVASTALQDGVVPHEERYAVIGDGGIISAEAARRLSCDAGIVQLVEDAAGNPLTVGRRTRSIPTSLRRALIKRDRCCRFPGCNNRVYVEGHHLLHWADGGAHVLSNLILLCSRHHRYVHEHNYRVELDANGEARFFDAKGRAVVAVPPPVKRSDLGWRHLVEANQELEIEPHTCGWDGEPVQYHEVVRALYRVDEGTLTADDLL